MTENTNKSKTVQTPSSGSDATPCCVLFLDFDGVIRVAVEGGWIGADQAEFCQARMKMLAAICVKTGAKIVVSSDWRNLENRKEIEGHLSPYLAEHLHDEWATPITGHRWNEVDQWLTNHPEVERYVILEDFAPHFDGCGRAMKARLVICSSRYGLVPELVPRITEILSHNDQGKVQPL